ncbi:hypothetical protein CLHOM_01240 [Clostridium homopropionicum DSM 5847]|uniref:Integral membrane protein n=1 Tax=Clostridium homopropionicum DSM 5847 TaxID=1121318 RepID=A0A0L6ZF94_9CLOT|nr:TIGR01906 family membrane protein [Clostridium homopropionicum]KOA21453.1 hypothetical protein CLHOM_01240 [Clostridium homopropionicum DSM 5847]SFG09290.1 integral membrane protein TIGR01906 [Clostridium homopropionicum]
MNNILNKMLKLIFVIAVILLIFILAVKFTFNFKPLYYFEIENSNIEEFSGLSESKIKENYNYVINYLNSGNEVEFNLPSLPFSDKGKIHFYEVKIIYKALDVILICSLAVIILCLLFNRNFILLLRHASILLLVIPITILIPFIINFDSSFTFFHKLFFRNDYWLFDPNEDPVINILPQDFFFHCALLILLIILISSLILRITTRKIKK